MCMPQIIDREREKFPFLHFCAFWTSLGLLVDLTFFFLPVISQTSDISFARSPPLLCHHRGFLRAQVGRSGVTANVQLTNILRILVDNICLINVEAIFKQMYCKSRFCPESSILYCLISLALILLISTSEVSKNTKIQNNDYRETLPPPISLYITCVVRPSIGLGQWHGWDIYQRRSIAARCRR